jgi:hypothetical protein
MILEGNAGIFVVYQGEHPVAITLNYFADDILFDAITVFDIDYEKFHLGSVSLLGLIDWCIKSQIRYLDFSKGYFDYKSRWGNLSYFFEYHIFYNKSSFRSRLLAFALKLFYEAKQRLRDKGVNDQLHRLAYRLKPGGSDKDRKELIYKWLDTTVTDEYTGLEEIPRTARDFKLLKPGIVEFLYLSQEHYRNLQLFRIPGEARHFLLKGLKQSKVLSLGGS